MFVPCDDVLDKFVHIIDDKLSSDFQKAKSKVLFKNCFVDYNIQGDINVLFDNQLIWNTLRTNYSVEDLIPYNLGLTVSF